MKQSVGRQYSGLKPAGDSPEVSEHYQYCFRNSPYEDSNEQYRKAGNRMFCVRIEAFMAHKCAKVLGRQPHCGCQTLAVSPLSGSTSAFLTDLVPDYLRMFKDFLKIQVL